MSAAPGAPAPAVRPPVHAVYAGTFDPVTLGHEDMIRRAARLSDRLVVAVARGHHKKTLFSFEERVAMVREAAAGEPRIEVRALDGLLKDFVGAIGANVLVRGMRSATDFDYELQMGGINRILMPSVEILFLMPSDETRFISGTYVREIARLGGPLERFVSPAVQERLRRKLAEG
ncbi:MAG: pantetheine-phosphate adenylyltransferase [Xylophilus ampelinus]